MLHIGVGSVIQRGSNSDQIAILDSMAQAVVQFCLLYVSYPDGAGDQESKSTEDSECSASYPEPPSQMPADSHDFGPPLVAEIWSAIRSREGYMAEWSEDADGFLLVEYHCPICAAATICQGFCRAELAVFQEVLGTEAEVSRVEHIPAGARRCAYRIREK
jgi:hypothetical protein